MNYPTNIAIKKKSLPSKGMLLESMLNDTNIYYREKMVAAIYKKPTPVTIVRTNSKDRSKTKITEAYFKIPSTTDYNGIYKGRYIDFEAKETETNTLPFTNFNLNQIEHLRLVDKLGAISFIIVLFKRQSEVFILETKVFVKLFDLSKLEGNKKSIPYEIFKSHGYNVDIRISPVLDYLKVVDELIKKENIE